MQISSTNFFTADENASVLASLDLNRFTKLLEVHLSKHEDVPKKRLVCLQKMAMLLHLIVVRVESMLSHFFLCWSYNPLAHRPISSSNYGFHLETPSWRPSPSRPSDRDRSFGIPQRGAWPTPDQILMEILASWFFR